MNRIAQEAAPLRLQTGDTLQVIHNEELIADFHVDAIEGSVVFLSIVKYVKEKEVRYLY